MSDFLTRLINRHLNIGDYVRPRLHTRFEPEAVKAAIPADFSEGITSTKEEPDIRQEKAAYTILPVKPEIKNPVDATSPVEFFKGITAKKGVLDNQKEKPAQAEFTSESAIEDSARGSAISGDTDESGRQAVQDSIGPEFRHQGTGNRDIEAKRFNNDFQESVDISKNKGSIDQGKNDIKSEKLSKRVSIPRLEILENARIIDNPRRDEENEVPKKKDRGRSTAGRPIRPRPISGRNIIAEQEGSLKPLHAIRLGGRSDTPVLKELRNSETEPIINVTIGRIDIRAVHDREQEEVKRQVKPHGILSLDQYLLQHSRGGNR